MSLDFSYEWFGLLKKSGFKMPDTYMVFDIETSGLDTDTDLIIEIGHLFVKDSELLTEPRSYVLNWLKYKELDREWFDKQLCNAKERISSRGGKYRFDKEVVSKGNDPIGILDAYHAAFLRWQELGQYIVTHNGYRYDTGMLEKHFKRFLNRDFKFDRNKLIDTGLFEKASQQHTIMLPDPLSSITKFYDDISAYRSKCQWSLANHCLPKYGLIDKHHLNIDDSHSADFDCHATHLLYQEYVRISECKSLSEV